MLSKTDLRHYYTPVQPSVRISGGDVSYQEFLPHKQLQAYIYCYWQLKTTKVLDAQFNYRVVADGCIDIFFDLNNTKENWVMGFCKKYTEFPLNNSFNYVGVRFLPTMFTQLFQVNAAHISNRFEHLSQVVPKVSQYVGSHLNGLQNIDRIVVLLDDYFLKHISTGIGDYDSRLYKSILIILKNQGVLNVETDLDTGISSRQLRRLFKHYIGDTPKTFSKVVQFQNILRAKPSSQSLRENKLFYDVGYYDQSHFIKDFKNFYGVTPSKAFGR